MILRLSESLSRGLVLFASLLLAGTLSYFGIRTAIAARARIGENAPKAGRDEAVARFARLARTSPEAAAERILRGVERREPRILIGSDARRIDVLQRLKPATYWKTISRMVK